MAYSEKQKKDIINRICEDIQNGRSLRSVLKDDYTPDAVTFYKWIDADEEKLKQYARACEMRADAIFDEMFDIADDSSGDREAFVGVNRIHRHKLQIDTRKWALAKMNPKKYGDKLQVDSTINDQRKTISQLFPDFDEEG